MALALCDAGVRGCDFFLSGLQCLEVSVLVLAGGALKVLFRLQPEATDRRSVCGEASSCIVGTGAPKLQNLSSWAFED